MTKGFKKSILGKGKGYACRFEIYNDGMDLLDEGDFHCNSLQNVNSTAKRLFSVPKGTEIECNLISMGELPYRAEYVTTK